MNEKLFTSREAQLREPLEANGVTINIIPQKALFIKDRNEEL
jgi:hypothetical protein